MRRTPSARPNLVRLEDRLAPAATVVDYTFGQEGKTALPTDTFTGNIYRRSLTADVSPAPDGKVVVATGFRNGQNADFAVSRLMAGGDLDPTFGTNGTTTIGFDLLGPDPDPPGSNAEYDDQVSVAPDGRVVVAGVVQQEVIPGPFSFVKNALGVVRLTADGQLDPTFDGDGMAVFSVPSQLDEVLDLVIRPDGGVLIATREGGGHVYYQITADGSPDPAGGPNGRTLLNTAGRVAAIRFDPAGRIYAAITTGTFPLDFYAARFTADNQPDPTYGTGGKTLLESASGEFARLIPLQVFPDGGAVFWVADFQGASAPSSAFRLREDGSLDMEFGTAGRRDDFPSNPVVAYPDGRLLASIDPNVVARYTAAGDPDPTWGPDGKASIKDAGFQVAAIWPGPDGTIIFAGDTSPRDASQLPNAFVGRFTLGDSNQFPTISNVTSQVLLAGKSIGPISFTVGDVETPTDQLTVTVTSSNEALLPPAGVAITGVGSVRSLTITPVAGKTGTATLTLTVRDGAGTPARDTFVVRVLNEAPSVSPIEDVTRFPGEAPIVLPFTVGDDQTPLDQLAVTVTSSNESLVPVAGVTVGGTGANRTLTVTPVGGVTGTATLTVTVRDNAEGVTVETFTVRVNARPTVSAIADFTTTVGQAIGLFPFTIGDSDTPPDLLVIEVASSNPALVPQAGLAITGSGADRGLTVTPVAGATGTATITITVRDVEGLTAAESFTLTMNPVGGGPPSPGVPVLVGYPQFGAGGADSATLYNPDQSVRYTVEPFAGFAGGVRTAAADFNGDGVADLVVGTGPGMKTLVSIRDGKSSDELFAVAPFEAAFTGGVYVAAGDLTGDGVPDLVVTPDEGGGPRVRAFNGRGFATVADFFGIDDPNFRGGARAAVGDVNGDGVGDLVVAAGFQGGPRVAGYSGKSLGSVPERVFGDFFAFEQSLRNGVFIAAGDIDGDGFAEVIAGGGPGGGPRVTAFSGKQLLSNAYDVRANFFGGDEANRGGIRVAVKDLDGDARADLVVGSGAGAGSRVTGYLGTTISPAGTPPTTFNFDAFAGFSGGVFVG